jgi:malate dehydrogenase
VPAGILAGFPVTCAAGNFTVVEGLEINDFSRTLIDRTAAELGDEREAVAALGLL